MRYVFLPGLAEEAEDRFKYFAAAFGFFGMATAVSNMVYPTMASRVAPIVGEATLDSRLADQAARENKRKGEAMGGGIFNGATVEGRMIVLELLVPNAPKRFDVSAATDKVTAQMKQRFCISKYHDVMRQGAGVVYRFTNPSGLVLIEAKADATICRTPT